MGWTYFEKPMNVKQWFENHLTWESEAVSNRCLKSAVKFKEAYAAVETINKTTGKREVWAAVFLLNYTRDSYYNFGYKDMEESMGPGYYNCPASILDLLTETESDYANNWREKCRKRSSKPKLKVGAVIEFKEPLSFTGWSASVFEKVKYGRKRNIFRAVDGGGSLVRIQSSTLNREYSLKGVF